MLIPTFQLRAYSERRGLIASTPPIRCRSFVQQFLQLLYVGLQNGANFNVTRISGSGISVDLIEAFRMVITGAGRGGSTLGFHSGGSYLTSTQSGIVVGTGTNAVTVTDFALQTPIADGTDSGQLEYLSCGMTNYRISGNTGSFDIERLFRNSSGGSITINEIALYGGSIDFNGIALYSNPRSFCLIRDLVSPGFTLNDGLYLRAIFTLSFSA